MIFAGPGTFFALRVPFGDGALDGVPFCFLLSLPYETGWMDDNSPFSPPPSFETSPLYGSARGFFLSLGSFHVAEHTPGDF